MSADLVPAPGGDAPRPPRKPSRKATPLDYLRDIEFQKRIDAGEEVFAAWLATMTHETFGIEKYRGKPSVDPRALHKTLARHIARMDRSGSITREVAKRALRSLTRSAVARLGKIVDGNFGEARVYVTQRGEERVKINAAAASVQVQAAVAVLKGAGVFDEAERSATVNVRNDVNVQTLLAQKLA